MRFTFTVIVGIDPRFEFVGTQQPVWFRHRPLAMDPFRFYGVQPRAFAGQWADHNTHALGTPLDLLIVLTDPVPHGMTAVPGGIVPDQQQGREALGRELGGAPRQKLYGDRTDGGARSKFPVDM